jgi:hypothetical protein
VPEIGRYRPANAPASGRPSGAVDRSGAAPGRRAARRFPPPWSVDEQEACFIARDKNDQALAYV